MAKKMMKKVSKKIPSKILNGASGSDSDFMIPNSKLDKAIKGAKTVAKITIKAKPMAMKKLKSKKSKK